ncbi:MAG: hypothetical protein QME64_08650 [bacterium]|nr:hypothetical protein [bacterium]
MRKEPNPFLQKIKQYPLVVQMKELIQDIFGTILLALRQRRPSAKFCPTFMVKLLSLLPGVGHMFAGFYIRGLFWFLIVVPVIAAFIFVVIEVGFINPHTLQAIGAMYVVLVFFCIRDVSRIVNEACSTERFIDYFQREKAASEKYRQFMLRQFNQKPDDEVEDLVLPNNKEKEKKT